MPIQAKKVTSTSTTDKQTKTKKKKKSSSTPKTRKESGSDTNEGIRRRAKSRRGRNSSDSSGSTGQETAAATLSSSCLTNDRTASSSSGENIAVSYQSETSDLDCAKGINERCHQESQATTTTGREPINESLRWDNEREDGDEEENRIRVYKLNRRKRYMDIYQKNSDDRVSQFYAS